jgi:protein SCO1/2
MNTKTRTTRLMLAAAMAVCTVAPCLRAQPADATAPAADVPGKSLPPAIDAPPPSDQLPTQVRGLEVEERLGAKLPMELEFITVDGTKVTLGDYFPAATGRLEAGKLPKPAVIMIGYYSCPVVCPIVADKFVESLAKIDLTAGKDFNFLSFSFDPDDTQAIAKGARSRAVQGYERASDPAVLAGFAFHEGNVDATRQLANAVGFPYRKIENGEFSHPVALFVISPEGVISRYIYGFEYPSTQIKLALLDASQGKLAKSIGDYFMNYCYVYDPRAGKYTIQAVRVMKIGGVVAVIGVFGLIGGLRLSEMLRRRTASRRAGASTLNQAKTNTAGGATPGGPSVTGPVA